VPGCAVAMRRTSVSSSIISPCVTVGYVPEEDVPSGERFCVPSLPKVFYEALETGKSGPVIEDNLLETSDWMIGTDRFLFFKHIWFR
jgi:hypothetical protein